MEVVPERQVRPPPELHQRRHLGPLQDRFDAGDEPSCRLAFLRPVEVIEKNRSGHYTEVKIAFRIDQVVESLRAALEVLIVRAAEQQRDQPRGARPQLAFAIELGLALAAEQSFELRQPAIERSEIRPLVVVAGHDRADRQRFAAPVTRGAESFVRTLDRRTPAPRLDEDP